MDIIKNDFKTIQFVCYNSAIDQLESRVYRYLLSKLLVSHTNKYKTKLDISVRLEALYGALLSGRCELNGNINTIGISLTIAHPNIVKDNTLLQDATVFFKSVLYDHDTFDVSIFEDEKRQLIEQWQSLKDNKAAYASYRFSKLFRLPDLSGYPLTGLLSQIKKATPEGLFKYYKQVFLKEDMHVIINGDIVSPESFAILQEYQVNKQVPFVTSFRKKRALKEIHETTEMNQAMIYLGYTFPIYRFDDKYPAALLANLIIGGYPESRLFKDIRENRALCYDINSRYDVYKGTFIISSGVAIDTIDEAKKAIIDLVHNMTSNGISLDELETAKAYIIHQLKASLDHQSYFTKRAYYAYLTKKEMSIEDRIKQISNITIDEVNDALTSLTLDTIYVLKGDAS